MSENPHHLESLLASLRPAAPDPELQERVKADLCLDEAWLPRQMRRAPRWLAATGWASLGAAAALVALAFIPPGHRAPQSASESFALTSTPTDSTPKLLSPTMPAGLVWSWEKQEWVSATPSAPPAVTAPPSGLFPVNY